MELWKQLLGNLIRFALVWLFGVLSAKNIIDDDTAHKLTDSGTFYVISFIVLAFPVVWQWAKVRYNIRFADALFNADSETTSKREVMKKVIGENKFVSSI